MATVAEQVQKVYIGLLGRAADKAGLDYWTGEIESGALTVEQLRANIVNEQPEYSEGLGQMTRAQAVNSLYENLFNRDAEAEGLDYWVNGGGAEVSFDQLVLALIDGAAASDTLVLDNKAEVAQYYTEQSGADYSAAAAKSVVDDVDASAESVADAKAAVDDNDFGGGTVLTQRADDLTGTAGDDVFEAPVTQNETGSGALANTFETGDKISGGEGNDTLNADLIATGTINDQGGVAISAETTGVENVFFRAQQTDSDSADNTTQAARVDAENMSGVEQWWTDNSRADVVIEDIRTATEDTTFGMRETDPGVGYTAYFNPLFLEGDVSADSSLSLAIQEIDGDQVLAANELENITVREVNFTLGGEAVNLSSDDIDAANTWGELEAAITAEIEAQELEGLTVSHQGNGQFVIDDANGRVFEAVDGEALIFGATADIDVRNRVEVGRFENEGPTETDVVLDGAGGGSQGGALNIGANSGTRGVEVFNTVVERDSHLTVAQSVNGAAAGNGTPNEYLQVLNLTNGETAGNLQIGERTDNLDERAQLSVDGDGDGLVTTDTVPTPDKLSGLYNVREVNAGEFQGDLNIAIALDNNAIGRYLDDATEEVEFNYTAGAGNDLFNIADLSTNGLSGDQDFAMNVDMGAGDDRLVINVPNVDATTVDGGEGANSIVVSQSHGTTVANTFEAFANFQSYEVEGTANTEHNYTDMAGVEDVVVATGNTTTAGGDTQLINMEADQSVTVSGKNQTIGNNSTADQAFGNIQLTNDQGAERTVTLDNTARLANNTNGVRTDGVLTVDNLTVDSDANLDGTASAVRDLTIDSDGERSTANAIAALNAADVESLNLVGSQDLSLNIESLANQAVAADQTAIDVDASALEGDLSLAIDGDQLASIAGNGTDTVVGTAGDNDTLMLHGDLALNNALNATGFEALQFGTAGGALFGDLALGTVTAASGIFDAASVTVNEFNVANVASGNLTLNNLGDGATVNLGDTNLDANGDAVNSQDLGGDVTLTSGADDDTAAARATTLNVNFESVLDDDDTQVLNVNDYGTINLDIAKAAESVANSTSDDRDLTLALDNDARSVNITGGDVNGLNAAGDYDQLDLTFGANELPNSLSTVDISGYAGEVTLTMQSGSIADADETDVSFIMSENSANVTLSDEVAAATAHNSIFEFTGEKGDSADVSTWTIANAKTFGDGTNAVNTDNATVLDVSDLGITGYAGLDIIDDGTDTRIVSEAQADDGAVSWEIVLTGVTGAADAVTEDNFIFA